MSWVAIARSTTSLRRPRPIGPEIAPRIVREVPLAATAAHVYTECARIWNPIHSDAAVASGAGLPGIILHGTATLALAVGVRGRRDVRWGSGARRAGRGALHRDGSAALAIRVRIHPPERDASVRFDVLNAEDRIALRDGLVCART
jgi:hypothetical protein